jgi:hypothetical protein
MDIYMYLGFVLIIISGFLTTLGLSMIIHGSGGFAHMCKRNGIISIIIGIILSTLYGLKIYYTQ